MYFNLVINWDNYLSGYLSYSTSKAAPVKAEQSSKMRVEQSSDLKVEQSSKQWKCKMEHPLTSLELRVEWSSDLGAEWSLELKAEWDSKSEVEWNWEWQKCKMGYPLTNGQIHNAAVKIGLQKLQ